MSKTCNGCEAHKENEHVETDSFAMTMLKDIKLNAKRWFIVAMVEFAIIVGIIAGALYFFCTTEFISTELSTEGGGHANSIINGATGDINNGTD